MCGANFAKCAPRFCSLCKSRKHTITHTAGRRFTPASAAAASATAAAATARRSCGADESSRGRFF